MIREMTNGKRLLMISDIRGVALTDDEHFDKVQDQEVQWQAIQALQPESSLVPQSKRVFHDSLDRWFAIGAEGWWILN